MIKKAFKTNQTVEYIWLVEIKYNSNKDKFTGILGTNPIYTNEAKVGEIIWIDKNEISDWMFLNEDNTINGAYTLKILRNRLSDKEKQLFDKENNLKFD